MFGDDVQWEFEHLFCGSAQMYNSLKEVSWTAVAVSSLHSITLTNLRSPPLRSSIPGNLFAFWQVDRTRAVHSGISLFLWLLHVLSCARPAVWICGPTCVFVYSAADPQWKHGPSRGLIRRCTLFMTPFDPKVPSLRFCIPARSLSQIIEEPSCIVLYKTLSWSCDLWWGCVWC